MTQIQRSIMKRSFSQFMDDSHVDAGEPPCKRSNTSKSKCNRENSSEITVFDNSMDNEDCSDIYKILSVIPWINNLYSFEISVLQIIAIYATGNILYCQDVKCNKPTSEMLIMNSTFLNKNQLSNLQICCNTSCNEYLTCCKLQANCFGCTSGFNCGNYYCIKCLKYQECNLCNIKSWCGRWNQCHKCKLFMCRDCAEFDCRTDKNGKHVCVHCYYNPWS